jgi:oligoendopeptidase F
MSHSPTQNRDAVSASDCWDLTPLFPDTDQWETLYKNLEERLPGYERFKGSLGDSLEVFSDALAFDHDMARDLEKIYTFAHLKNDEDKTQSLGEDIFQRAMNLYTRIMDASSFMVPEIQTLGTETLTAYMADERLKDYEFYLEKIIRNIPHTRDAQVEQILAMAGESLAAPRQIFSQLDNADLVFGTIRDKEGKSKDLTHGNFVTFLSQGDRGIRKQAFHQYYAVYDRHKHSIAASLGASIKKDLFLARARNFSTARQASLFKDNVPEAVYEKLISSVRQGLSGLHNYLNFRRKALGLETLCIYDTYVPVIPDVDFKMGYDEAVETCIKALAPLGEEYCRRLEKGLTRGWVDRYENKGKRSGAYSSGCYDSPPYILLNYEENTINSLYTLIHEAGHSMHSLYSKESQPYPSADYTIFVAEVASTLNETLLTRYLLKKYDGDPRMKAYILNREIDNIRATFFRQTMFAEFETIVHSKAAQNQALTL